MEEIYKNTLLLIHSLTQMDGVCNQFSIAPNDENGNKIIEIVDKCEEKFLKVKEEIVKMVQEADIKDMPKPEIYEQEVSAIKTEGGFLISDRKKI